MNNFDFLKHLAPAVYLAVVVWAAFTAARIGFGDYFADAAQQNGSLELAEKAGRFDPENPEIPKIIGVLLAEAENYEGAILSFRESAKRRANDYHVYLRLGHALSKSGDFAAARENYLRSIELAPNYAQPRRYLGRLLLKTQNYEEAFAYLRRSAELDSQNYAELLRLGRKHFSADLQTFERVTSADDANLKKEKAAYFIKHQIFTDGLRDYLTGSGLTEKEKNLFINRLVKNGEFTAASDIWRANRGQTDQEILIDGGFEKGAVNDESGFGWQFDAADEKVEFGIDDARRHAENNSLTVRFNGESKLKTPLLSQLAVLAGNSGYRLEFSYAAENLSSAANPSIIISDPDFSRIYARQEMKNVENKDWRNVSLDFVAPVSGVIQITLLRENCAMTPCPIFGQIWLDGFRITKK